jgi:hypothetical protein
MGEVKATSLFETIANGPEIVPDMSDNVVR